MIMKLMNIFIKLINFLSGGRGYEAETGGYIAEAGGNDADAGQDIPDAGTDGSRCRLGNSCQLITSEDGNITVICISTPDFCKEGISIYNVF